LPARIRIIETSTSADDSSLCGNRITTIMKNEPVIAVTLGSNLLDFILTGIRAKVAAAIKHK
jgi:hypothetical protein